MGDLAALAGDQDCTIRGAWPIRADPLYILDIVEDKKPIFGDKAISSPCSTRR